MSLVNGPTLLTGSNGSWWDNVDPTTYVHGLGAAGTTSYFIASDASGVFWWYDLADVNTTRIDPAYAWSNVSAINTTTPQCLTYVSSTDNNHYYLQGLANG